jgi:hypothetical protein
MQRLPYPVTITFLHDALEIGQQLPPQQERPPPVLPSRPAPTWPPAPPIVAPPTPSTPRDQMILQIVRQLRGGGSRGDALASMFLEFVGAGSRLEPTLMREIPNYRQWLDWRSYGNHKPIDDPSDEWTLMKRYIQQVRAAAL